MKNELYFNVDTPALLGEVLGNHGAWALAVPIRILKTKLSEVAGRAIEIDDPKLNILMLEMKLYEVEHNDIQNLIKVQKKRINENEEK